jgi:two-component system sensor histidine kinase RegB
MAQIDELSFALAAAGRSSLSAPVGRLRLRTLLALRWLAVIGQTAAVIFVYGVLEYELPLGLCLGAIAASAWLNIFLAFWLPSQRLVSEWEAAGQLAYDILQLAFLLALTGGLDNPFILLFVAPVTISAATLRPSYTLGLAALTFACVAGMAMLSLPLPWDPAGGFQLPAIYQVGLVTALIIGLLFTSGYAWRVAVEEAKLADALIATQSVLAREQRLSALGGLAAAAAHELGTPLATIQVAAKEMARELPEGDLKEDARLIASQSERCREILRRLAVSKNPSDAMHERLALRQLLDEAASRHPDIPINRIDIAVAPGEPGLDAADEPLVRRSPEALYGLGNVIENAMEFAESMVAITAEWTRSRIIITVEDDGPGFDPDILPRLGEPYVTTRGAEDEHGDHEGMGLGFFIAKTLLERSGGRVTFRNRPVPARGALVRVVWSRAALEADPV